MVEEEENEPNGSNGRSTAGSQPATRHRTTRTAEALATAAELAAVALEAGGRDGPAKIAQAAAHLLRLIAILGRCNDQM